MQTGLIVTHMRDSVSWAFYIGNFTFLVGVAAAAIMLVIPAYIYHWEPIKEIVILGELLAISAVIMCLLFVTVDMGHPGAVLASHAVHRRAQFSRFAARLGRAGAQPVPDAEHGDRRRTCSTRPSWTGRRTSQFVWPLVDLLHPAAR